MVDESASLVGANRNTWFELPLSASGAHLWAARTIDFQSQKSDAVGMASSIESLGSVKLPHQRVYQANVRMELDLRLNNDRYLDRLEGFKVRIFAPKASEREQPEITMSLNVNQWFELIEAMQHQLELAGEHRIESVDPPD